MRTWVNLLTEPLVVPLLPPAVCAACSPAWHAQLTPISGAEAVVCMKQVTEATRRGWILLLLVLTARCQACEAGSSAGATSWRKRGVLNTASYANDGRHSNRCCRIDEAATSVHGLRGGSGASIGGSTSVPRGVSHDGNMIARYCTCNKR